MAEQIQPGAKFVAAAGSTLVAEAPAMADDEVTIVVVRADPSYQGPFEHVIVPFEEQPLPTARLRDIYGRYLLLCDQATCQLFEIDADAVRLLGTVPPEVEAQGVASWAFVGVCVAGNGIQCLSDGTWTEVLPPDSGSRLHDTAAGSTALWAAGEDGRIVVVTPSCWRELPSGTGATLRLITTDPSRELWATAAGDGGVIVHLSLEETITCTYGDADWVASYRSWGSDWGYGVAHQYDVHWLLSATGQMTRGLPSHTGDWCSLGVDEPIVDITISSCGVASNPRFVTATALYGGDFCAID